MSLVGVRPDHDTSRPTGAAAALRTTTAIRERAQYLLNRARAGDSLWFSVDDDSLPAAAAEVADVTRAPLPRPAHPVPQPLASFRGRRRGPQSRARLAARS